MKAVSIPLACYLGMTLGVPLLDGRHGARYLEHGATVIVATIVVTALAALLRRATQRLVSAQDPPARARRERGPARA